MNMKVAGFQVEYHCIDSELKKCDRKQYDRMILICYMIELEKGFIIKKIGRTTRSGTKVTFKLCESQNEANVYSEKVNKLIREYNDKYGESYCEGAR